MTNTKINKKEETTVYSKDHKVMYNNLPIRTLNSVCKRTNHRVSSKGMLYSNIVMKQSLLFRIIANEKPNRV